MKGFGIYVKNDLLEPKHYQAMGESIWLYLWLLDKMTSISEEGKGKILGGKPITYDDIYEDLGMNRRTYVRLVSRLREAGYIDTLRTPKGLIFTINKAVKIFKGSDKSVTSQGQVMRQKVTSDAPNTPIGCAKSAHPYIDNTVDNTIITTPLPPKSKTYNDWFNFWQQKTGLDQNRKNPKNPQGLKSLLERYKPEELEQLIQIANMAHGDKYVPKGARAADFYQLNIHSDDILVWGKSKVLTKGRIVEI